MPTEYVVTIILTAPDHALVDLESDVEDALEGAGFDVLQVTAEALVPSRRRGRRSTV